MRSCEKTSDLTQRRQGAKLAKNNYFIFCAFFGIGPLRKTVLLSHEYFYSFVCRGKGAPHPDRVPSRAKEINAMVEVIVGNAILPGISDEALRKGPATVKSQTKGAPSNRLPPPRT
jgi:hypothetical protein